MAKSKKRKLNSVVITAAKVAEPDKDEKTGLWVGGLLHVGDLEVVVDTLQLLAAHPDLISTKPIKGLRTAVHDYLRVANDHVNPGSSLSARISAALIDQRHTDALVLLSEMRIRRQEVKLGSLQRWIRECDAVVSPEMSPLEAAAVWQVLDAILRTTYPEWDDTGATSSQRIDSVKGVFKPHVTGKNVRWFPPFRVPQDSPILPHQFTPTLDTAQAIASAAALLIKPLHVTPALQRKPPNRHPAIVYYSPPSTFPLASNLERKKSPCQKHSVEGVPGAFVISNVLEPAECQALVLAAELVGMQPDEPIEGSAAAKSSVLAHNLIWLADEPFLDILYNRIVAFLPKIIHGGAVRGINARFRLYRYRVGALYRPHVGHSSILQPN